ncbi:MAG: hemolysin family protein [Planctomycetaceae bacterium]
MIDNLVFFSTVAGLLLLVMLTAVARISLREFSRSHLEAVCRERGRAELFGEILARRERVQLGVAILHVVALAVTVTWWVNWLRPVLNDWSGWSIAAAIGAAVIVFLFADVVFPWGLGRVWGEVFLVRSWRLLAGVTLVLEPVLVVARGTDRLLHRVAGRAEPATGDVAALSEEIRSVVDEGQRGGVLENAARTMIHQVMDLHDEDVAAVMTPRTDMVCISAEESLEEARQQLLAAGHTRVPVVGESTDDIVGILYAKDLLGHLQSGDSVGPSDLREVVREPFYVPETTGIDTLLETLKREKVHLAIVLDEYGGVAGLVTLEDVLEEIVGEIEDEYDEVSGELIRSIGPGLSEIDARAHIDDLNERFGFGIPEDENYDTLAGFVITRFGRIPLKGEEFSWNQWRFFVDAADKRRVLRMRVQGEIVESAEVDPAV